MRDIAEQNRRLDAAWRSLCDNLLAASEQIAADERARHDPRLRAQGYRYLLNLLNAGLEQRLFSADPDLPEVGRLQDSTKRYATESPDCLFGHTELDPDGTYRLTGTGGSAHYVGITLYRHLMLYENFDRSAAADFTKAFSAATSGTAGTISSPGELELNPHGDFELILSARPHEGNWLRLTPDIRNLITRQYFYDWDNERAHHISIERLDGTHASQGVEPERVSDQVRGVGEFVEGYSAYWASFYAMKRAAKYNLLSTERVVSGSYSGQNGCYIAYGGGFLDLGPDQAAIITVRPPHCHFWNMHVGDHWGQSLDYTFRQTSLNGHQAVLDEAGVFRAVVAHHDPGVANWLDTAGNRYLQLVYRWWLTDSPDLPTPAMDILPFDELDSRLPASTPRLGPARRAQVLDARRLAVLRRYQR